MSDNAAPSFKTELSKQLKRITEHWTLISFLSGVIGALLGLCILMTYTKAIGRKDLLTMALDTSSTLLPWITIVVFVLLAYIAILIVTTALFSLAVSIFNKAPNLQPTIAVCLLLPTVSGTLFFIACIFHEPDWGKLMTATFIVIIVAISTLLLKLNKKFEIGIEFITLIARPDKAASKFYRHLSLLFLTSVLCFTVMTAVYPLLLVLKSYTGEDTPSAVNMLMFVSMVVAVLTLLPVVVFFTNKKNAFTRAFRGAGATLTVSLVVIAITPGASSTIVYLAASMMGIRETTSSMYLLQENFGVKDFDSKIWVGIESVRDLPAVKAFPLFALGDILLLCPSTLEDTKLREWPQKSKFCVVIKSSKATRLPARSEETTNENFNNN